MIDSSVRPGPSRDLFPVTSERCDLHSHSSASDGRLPPARLVAYAREKGLSAFAICDHDTVSGVRSLYAGPKIPDVMSLLILDGIEIVPGVEINSDWNGHEVHILGYYVPFGEGPFKDFLRRMQSAREERVARVAALLRTLGMEVEVSSIMELSTGDSVGRPHVAQAMAEKGYVSSVREAFERYLGVGKPAYVDRDHLTPHASVQAISSAGGVAVWAHPGTSGSMHLLPELVGEGLLGIEAFHPEHDRRTSELCRDLAACHGLVVTGGSDFHGEGAGEGGDLGSIVVAYGVVETLRALASAKR